ncbi:hypothetical protein L208DRAFT_1366867 [Tricholoma matsutake]|nr:hypothetical protein L208DRAFT_1366867 [Tricholoma matsutake 945]
MSTSARVGGCSTTPGSPSTTLSPPIPLPAPPIPRVDALTENQFTVDAPETRAGRKRKTRDLRSVLVVCTCGQAVLESKISQNGDVIMCRRAGCETGWYHLACVRVECCINLWICDACGASGEGQGRATKRRARG